VCTVLKRLAGLLLVLVLLAGAAAGGAAWLAWRWVDTPLPLATPAVEATIEPGSSPRTVAERWVAAGVQTRPRWLYEWFRFSGQARQIRAGSYEIHSGDTPRSLLAKMVRGDEVLESVRFVEGWTVRQMRAALAEAPRLRPTTGAMSDAALMAALGAAGVPAEGRFFPDTYRYARNASDLSVLRQAHAAMARQLQAAWDDRAPDSPLKSPDELLILASIVEKETGLEADRGKVAGVFANRLRLGMLLQTDPTIIYGLGEAFDGVLRRSHLQTDGPFNTYTRPGLPPTPIALPGAASLRAAARPDPTRALFFVARGDGISIFSDTLADHNRAVQRYQRGPAAQRARNLAESQAADSARADARGEGRQDDRRP
jgi:UPF0755 protein